MKNFINELMLMQVDVWAKEMRERLDSPDNEQYIEDTEAENRRGDDAADLYLMRDCRVGGYSDE